LEWPKEGKKFRNLTLVQTNFGSLKTFKSFWEMEKGYFGLKFPVLTTAQNKIKERKGKRGP